MFLISRDKDTCVRALSKLISKIEEIACGPILFVELRDHWLGWARSKPHENLHVFNDGILIGKLSFSEKPVDTITFHVENLPAEIHPLATGVSITRKGMSTLITPFNITNIFYSGDSVSDMQLLIAEAEGFLPSPEGVAVLSTIGYFPGNMTLFREIKKIPFLAGYDLNAGQLTDIPSISLQKPDDVGLIRRFIEIIPDHPRQYLGMSAGYDSRFVLGILRQRGVVPYLIHVCGEDTEKVLRIAEQLDLPCTNIVATDSSYLSPETYTLVTDAQIYFRGGNFSCVRDSIESESLYYTGTISATIRYYPLRTVKIPGPVGNIYDRFIDHLFIDSRAAMTHGLREINSPQDIKKYLIDELKFGNDYCSFRTKSEWANWLFYLHKGIRWSPAALADLSCFTQLVFLLSDIEALMLGISSDLWSNFKNDRLRSFNATLLPELTVPYSDGTTYLVDNGLRNSWEKINYEYGDRLKKYYLNPKALIRHLTDRKKIPAPRKKNVFSFRDVNFSAQCFTRYFTNDFQEIVTGSTYSYWLKRAAVTVGYALQFLDH